MPLYTIVLSIWCAHALVNILNTLHAIAYCFPIELVHHDHKTRSYAFDLTRQATFDISREIETLHSYGKESHTQDIGLDIVILHPSSIYYN